MRDYLSNIKRDLSETSSELIMITLTREDVEKLIYSYERLKAGAKNDN